MNSCSYNPYFLPLIQTSYFTICLQVLEKRGIGRDYPIAMDPVYAVGADPYYTKHYGYPTYPTYPRAYMGPMAPEYYARPYPAIGYGEPTKDMYQWREVES